MDGNFADILAEFPDISPQWLLAGKGPMLLSDFQESGKLDIPLLESIMVEVEQQLASKGKNCTMARKAALVAFIYEQSPDDLTDAVRAALRLMMHEK